MAYKRATSPRQNTAQKIVSRTKRTSFYQDVVFLSLSHTRTNLLIYKEINKRKKTLHHSDLVHYRQLTIPSFLFFFLCTKFREAHRSRRHCNTGPMLGAGWSKLLLRLPVPKIRLICSPRIGDVSDIKLIRTDFFFFFFFFYWKALSQGLGVGSEFSFFYIKSTQ